MTTPGEYSDGLPAAGPDRLAPAPADAPVHAPVPLGADAPLGALAGTDGSGPVPVGMEGPAPVRRRPRPVVDLRGVHKIYGAGDTAVAAVDGVNVRVHRGDFVAVMGASGSGKTTLMNIIGCLDVPSHGRYLLDGVDTRRLDARRQERLTPILGSPPSLINLPPGCPFTPRCPIAAEICDESEPELLATTSAEHVAACHFSATLEGKRPHDLFSTASVDDTEIAELLESEGA